MRILFAIVMIFLGTMGTAQENYKIRLSYSNMSQQYELELHRNGENCELFLAEKVGFTKNWSLKDSLLYQRIYRQFRRQKITEKDVRTVLTLSRKYKVYKRDSMILDVGHPLIEITDRLANASKKELQGKQKDQIVIDGSSVRVEIFNHGVYKQVFAHAPSASSHPLIHRFMKGVLDTYSKGEPEILIKKTNPAIPVMDHKIQIKGRKPEFIIKEN